MRRRQDSANANVEDVGAAAGLGVDAAVTIAAAIIAGTLRSPGKVTQLLPPPPDRVDHIESRRQPTRDV